MASVPVMASGPNGRGWKFLCPECRGPALKEDSNLYCCNEGRRWTIRGDVYPLLSERGRRAHDRFLSAYRLVRQREGWGGDAQYYRELPFRDRSGRHKNIWRIRARSFRMALREIQRHFGSHLLETLEMGAGNCWFSSRLARLGHRVLATDVFLDSRDGLQAFDLYREQMSVAVERAQADMEDLPLADEQFDLVVANGSIHYARRLGLPVSEAYRLLREGGLFLVLDSPTYRCRADGEAMVDRRLREHRDRYGIVSEPVDGRGYLLLPEFVDLLERSGFSVHWRRTFDGVERSVRRWLAPRMGWDSPAEFMVFAAFKRVV